MQVRKQPLEPDMEQRTGSKLGKEYIKAVYCHPVYLTCMQSIMWNAGLDEAQAEIKIAWRFTWYSAKKYKYLKREMSWTSDMPMTPLLG